MDELTTPRARAVYENTNGFPLSHGKTLHMEVIRPIALIQCRRIHKNLTFKLRIAIL